MSIFTRAPLLLIAFVGLAPAARSAQYIDVPVMITADENNACANGEITGLDPKGDGFPSVRSGPGGQPFREIDRLYNGNQIYICGFKGKWYSVVYTAQRGISEVCGVATSWATSQPYTGPCKYGWVYRDYVKVIAE